MSDLCTQNSYFCFDKGVPLKGRLSEIQKYRIEELKEKGFDVKVMKPC